MACAAALPPAQAGQRRELGAHNAALHLSPSSPSTSCHTPAGTHPHTPPGAARSPLPPMTKSMVMPHSRSRSTISGILALPREVPWGGDALQC